MSDDHPTDDVPSADTAGTDAPAPSSSTFADTSVTESLSPETPRAETPLADPPVAESPAVDSDTSSTETPSIDAPVGDAPVAETPASEKPEPLWTASEPIVPAPRWQPPPTQSSEPENIQPAQEESPGSIDELYTPDIPAAEIPTATAPVEEPKKSKNKTKVAKEEKAKKKKAKHKKPSRKRKSIEWLVIVVAAAVAAVLIRTFLLQSFYIPSESMENTLHIHDRVLVNKMSYKFHKIRRGDVVVFRKPSTELASKCYNDADTKDLIKRVIALPGETVESRKESGVNTIYVNDRALSEPYLKSGTSFGSPVDRQVVPDGSIWVMGDNRGNSRDSRCAGPIPVTDVVGRAFVVIWPLDAIRFI